MLAEECWRVFPFAWRAAFFVRLAMALQFFQGSEARL